MKDILQRIKARLRAFLKKELVSGVEIPLEEFYFSKKPPFTSFCGSDASCQLNWVDHAISLSPGLRIKAAGYSRNLAENWIKVERIPYQTPIASGNFDALGLWLHSADGSTGNFHLSLIDPSGVEYTLSDPAALSSPGWFKKIYKLKDFKVASWSPRKSDDRLTNFSSYSFALNLPPKEGTDVLQETLTIGCVFLIDSASPSNPVETLLSDSTIPEGSRLSKGFDFSGLNNRNVEYFLFASSGDDAIVNLLPEQKIKVNDQTGIRINYSINSDDFHANHVLIRSLKFDEIIQFNEFHGVILTLDNRSESCGELRLTLEDDAGNTSSVSLYRIFDSAGYNRYYISSSRFKCFSRMLKNISSYEFSFYAHWNRAPIKNDFFLFPPEFVSAAQKQELPQSHVTPDEITENCSMPVPSPATVKSVRKWWGLDKAAIFIEPTNLCNLRCIMCNHGNFSFKRPIGVMKFEHYKKILDEVDRLQANIWEIGPYWLGESFIHPQINQIISYTGKIRKLGERFINYTLHTNGLLLDRKHYDAILDSGLDHLLFSIDAATAETYRKIRRGGELSSAVERILDFKSFRDSLSGKRPALIVQFIVMDQNVNEIVQFANFWSSRGFKNIIYAGKPEENPFGPKIRTSTELFPYVSEDSIFIKRLEPNALTKIQKHREIIPPESSEPVQRRPCASLWKMLSVSWDGRVTACCRDDQVEMEVGNVFNTGLEDIWFGKTLEDLRISQILGNFDATPKCVNCVNWVKYHLSADEIKSYLYSIGKEYLLDRPAGQTRHALS